MRRARFDRTDEVFRALQDEAFATAAVGATGLGTRVVNRAELVRRPRATARAIDARRILQADLAALAAIEVVALQVHALR